MTAEPRCAVRDRLSGFIDGAERERVVVTRNGRPAAVLIGYEDVAALEEILEILCDDAAMTDIREAHNEVARGEVIKGVDAVWATSPKTRTRLTSPTSSSLPSHCLVRTCGCTPIGSFASHTSVRIL